MIKLSFLNRIVFQVIHLYRGDLLRIVGRQEKKEALLEYLLFLVGEGASLSKDFIREMALKDSMLQYPDCFPNLW